MSFTGYWSTSYDGSAARTSLRELRATGATWAMVLVTVYQDNVDSTTISRTEPNTPTDASLNSIIAYAHRIGLKVMLKPQLDLLNDPSHWRGQIGLDFTDADWTAWFASYDEQIVHYAQLAADAGCQQFSVGCELDSTVRHEAAWRQVMADVRAVYKGKLTYADDQIASDPGAVAWWDAVDLIGQDAYPTLSDQAAPHDRPARRRLGALLPAAAAAAPALRQARHLHRDRRAQRRRRGARSLGLAELGKGRPGRPTALVSGRAQDLRGALLDEGPVLWQWYTDPTVGGRQRRQLHAARQAGRDRAAPVVQAAVALVGAGQVCAGQTGCLALPETTGADRDVEVSRPARRSRFDDGDDCAVLLGGQSPAHPGRWSSRAPSRGPRCRGRCYWRGAASGPVTGAVFKTVCGAVLPSWVGSTPMPFRQCKTFRGVPFAPTCAFR